MSLLPILEDWNDDEKRRKLIREATNEANSYIHPGLMGVSVKDVLFTQSIRPISLETKTVPKGWGHELHICSNDEFCGKELHIRAGHKFSMHLHRSKREVFRLRTGSVELTTINMEDASRLVTIMQPGDVIEIPRLLPHSIRAIEDSVIDEYSTQDRAEDSYRVEPGSSQIK